MRQLQAMPQLQPLGPVFHERLGLRTDNPSTAAAITTPANDDRDSRNSSVCIPEPAPPPNSCANSGSPAATHADAGSRRNSASEHRIHQQPLDQPTRPRRLILRVNG